MPPAIGRLSMGAPAASQMGRGPIAIPAYSFEQVSAIYREVDFVSKRGEQWRGTCPLHGGTRPNFAVNARTATFFCHSKCGVGGGPTSYLDRLRGGNGSPRGADYRHARQELGRRLEGRAPTLRQTESTRALPLPSEAVAEDAKTFWNLCQPVTAVPRVRRWLDSRSIDADAVELLDLARVVPEGAQLPLWAGSWPRQGYVVAFPLFDCTGHMVAARLRFPGLCDENRPKSVSPKGIRGAGLVMADPTALEVLRCASKPDWWADGNPAAPFRVVIAEGEPDFLSWCIEPARQGLAYSGLTEPAVVGVASGSLTAAIVDRFPLGTEFVSAFDNDQGGERHHSHLLRVARDRHARREIVVKRWRAA